MKRPADMSFDEYRQTRLFENQLTKIYLRGTLVWNSGPSYKRLIGLGLKNEDDEPLTVGELPRGRTYIKKEHGPIGRDVTGARNQPESQPIQE